MSESHAPNASPLHRYIRSGGFFHYYHWLYLLVPLVSGIVAVAIGADKETIEFVIGPACLAINLFLVWFKSVREGDDELTPGRSLLSYKLLPDKSGRELAFNTEIAIIEDRRSDSEFCRQLDKRFKSRLSPEDKNNLVFRSVSCGSSSKKEFERKFRTELSNAKAVVVVRTKELEESTQAYDAVESLAYGMSEVPILFTKLAPEECGTSEVPKNFRSIPKDANTLPWRLLQRANERGSTWRTQAGFNGLVVANLFAFLVAGFFFALHASSQERESHAAVLKVLTDYDAAVLKAISDSDANALKELKDSDANVTKELYDAIETKEQYVGLTAAGGKNAVSVSYWFMYDGRPHIYVTTEKERHQSDWPDNKSSIIGCAYAYPNHYAQWDSRDPSNVHVWSYAHEEEKNAGCVMHAREDEPIPSIVCASYNPPTVDRSYMVGVCVFAGNGRHVVINDELSKW